MALEQFTVAMKLILERIIEIFNQPAINKEMLWILLPLLTALFLLELYFGKYKEELGWNSAVSNALVLFFVGMNLCAFLYSRNQLVGFTLVSPEILTIAIKKSLIAFIIVLESVFLIVLNFFHAVSKKFAFGISSALIMNYLGVISVILIYSNIGIDMITVPAILLLFILLVIFFWIIQTLTPKTKELEKEEEEED